MDKFNQPLYFLKAKTAEELHLKMIANNRRFRMRFHYLTPVPFKGEWYVWYEIPESVRAKEELNVPDKKES